jgi:Cof subfamily protein (haloacid dehalogenase superfamily)
LEASGLCKIDMTESALKAAGQKIRLIVSDIDWTLVDDKSKISAETAAVVKAVLDKGLTFSVASGRIPRMVEMHIKRLGLDAPFIASGGAAICDPKTDETPYKRIADSKAVYQLLQFCKSRNMEHIAMTSDTVWCSHGGRRLAHYEYYNEQARSVGARLTILKQFSGEADYKALLKTDIYKVLITDLSSDERALVEDYIRSLGCLDYTRSEPTLLDVMAKGTDKGKALKALIKMLGFEKEEVCTFGDYLNDIPMFQESGLSFAVANGHPEAKAAADAVTDTNQNNGVAKAIEKYIRATLIK